MSFSFYDDQFSISASYLFWKKDGTKLTPLSNAKMTFNKAD